MKSSSGSFVVGRGIALCLLLAPIGLSTACGHSRAGTPGEAHLAKERVLLHVVLFKFKDDVSPDQVREIENAFAALPGKIPAIVDFEWGTDVGVEDKANGFTHAFLVTFANEAGRD